jgi:hypothetical protein
MNFSIRNSKVENVLLVDGITRTGKFFLAKIVSEFKGIEFFQYLQVLEQVPYIYRLGGMNKDAAIALIKSSVDYGVYNQIVGRNLNHRVLDRSSIYNSINPELYLKRQFENFETDHILQLMRGDDKKFQFVTHNALANVDILLDAYPRLNMIHIIRNPVDLVYSWYRKNYGKINSPNNLSIDPSIEKNGFAVPWYHDNWDDDYHKMGDVDLIIKSIKTLLDLNAKKVSSLSDLAKSKIFIIKYEDLVLNPLFEMKKLSNFLGVSVNAQIKQVLLREGLPNKDVMSNHNKKSKFIYELASDSSVRILNSMERDYNESKTYCNLDIV